MKEISLFAFCFIMLLSVQSFAQEGEEMDPEMQAWMEYMTPGEMHKMLEKSNGTWHTKVTMWMAPDTEPMMSEGSTINEMILGGRYQKSTHSGEMMGMPFEGMSIVGYDNTTKKFNSVWVDNMGTGMMFSSGLYNKETGKVEMIGNMVDPISGNEIPVKQTMQIVDDNHHVFEMYMNDESGKEFRAMLIEYTRN